LNKHCNTCAYSFQAKDRESLFSIRKTRQHCKNPEYNSLEYTREMFAEDREHDYCRFWTPVEERTIT